MKLGQVTIVHVFCLFGAIGAYRGADNRLVAGYQDERRYHDRHQPQIEYHYPEISNQISRQHLPTLYQHSSQQSSPGHWRNKSPPTVGYVNHIKVERRKPGHHLGTSGVFRTSQWGTARIPYPGASVNVVPAVGRKKTYRGLVTTTVLSPEEARKSQAAAESSRALVHDEPASPDPCYRCPSDRAVVAMKGTKFAPLEKPAPKPCHRRSWSPEVRLELLSGIRPGYPLSEGAHIITARLVYRHKTLETCKFRYNVVVRRCPPLVLPDHLNVSCTSDNAWGSECRFSCARGYQPLGPTVTQCGDDLQWTQHFPHCTEALGCTIPPTPDNGKLSCKTSDDDNGDLLEEGTTCRYSCKEGFSIVDQNEFITCSAGEWNKTEDVKCYYDFRIQRTPESVVTEVKRHRKNRPSICRPNPCEKGDKCEPGPLPVLALCSCPANVPQTIDGQPCHKLVLVDNEPGKKKKKKGVQVVGTVYTAKGSGPKLN